MKALKMSIIHVLAFVVSWTPYTFMATWLGICKVFWNILVSTKDQRGFDVPLFLQSCFIVVSGHNSWALVQTSV